jgi:hypothetical protein
MNIEGATDDASTVSAAHNVQSSTVTNIPQNWMCIDMLPGTVSHNVNPRIPPTHELRGSGGDKTFIRNDDDNHITTTERSVNIPKI